MKAEDYETAETLFRGGGEMGTLLRSLDWSQTPLGTVETWSNSLKTAVQILLTELDRAKPTETTLHDAEPQSDSPTLVAASLAAQLDAFCIKLADALRPLTDATKILEAAARILGEALAATRVIYAEVASADREVIVHCNYTDGVAPLSGRFRLEDYHRNLTADHQAGHTQVVTDIPQHPDYTNAEKARYQSLDIAAHIDVPLIKNNQFVALLAVQQSTPRQWTEIEVKQVEETAERTWAAVERARAEAALRESEAKYRRLFEAIDEGYFVADVIFDAANRPIDVSYLEANPAVKRITGLDLAGHSLREIDPNYESAWWEAYGRVAQTGIAERQELYTELLDSWFSFYTFKVGDADSRRIGCVFQDITQRKRTEQALRDSEQRYRTLFNSIDEGFCVYEPIANTAGEPYDYRILEINPAFETLTGLTQTSGKTGSVLVPTLEPFWHETHARVMETGEPTRFESYLQALNRWFDVYITPIDAPQGQQFAVLFRDITDRTRVTLNAEFLATVLDDLAEITEVGDIVRFVGDRLHRYLNISSCAFVAINERADEAVIHHHWHLPHVPNLVGVYALPQFVAQEFLHTAQAGQPIVVQNVATDPRIVNSEKYAALSIGAELNIPLIQDGEWKFSLTVFHSVPYDWRKDEIALMQELASRIWTKLERATAEVALRDSRAELERQVQKFNATLSTITDYVFRLDRDGRFLYANQVLLDLWGLTETEAIGKTMAELNYSKAVERQLLNDVRQVFETGETVRSETAYTSSTGVDGYFENFLSPVLAANGTVESVVGSSRNISDRKQAETELQASEARFRNMADNAPMMVWVTDPTGYCTYLSRSWYEFTGQTEATGHGFGWLNATHPDDRASSEAIFLAANDRQEAFQIEYRLRRQDGQYRTCIDAAKPWFGADGAFKGYIGSVIDIDDRIQAEAALRQSEERYRTLFESIDEGFCVVEVLVDQNNTPVDYRVLEINPVFEQQTGIQDAVGKTARQLNLEDHWIEIYGRVALTGESVRFEIGSDVLGRWFDVYACRTGEPEARKVAIVFKDVSERKRAETEREQLLQREQTAREAAENANRIKDEFLAVLSHELRSPLNPILGWTRLLQSGNLDAAKTKQALATIERNAKLQTELIQDLLDVSRILQGKLSLTVRSVDLVSTIESAIETVKLAADAKAITIQTELDADVGQISGDSSRLHQVVWNLVSNAVKFTGAGGRVTVRLTRSDSQAQITVSDTGKGIKPEFVPFVFDYFRQEDGATTRRFGGLGLGLAIVRHLVELHGGTVQASSSGEGQGATFIVRLPFSESGRSPANDRPPALAINDCSLEGIRILIVDDEPDMLDLAAFALQAAGATTQTANRAEAALRAIVPFQPDVLVSDIGMPDIDGYMLLRQIRGQSPEQGAQIPAIALTAYATEFDQEQALQAGFQKHLSKPVEPEILIREIIKLLNNHQTD